MKIAIASDHRGYAAKERITALLKSAGHEVRDYGCNTQESCDYPDLALPAADSIARGDNERAVLICGTGLGMSIAANKIHGVRAALCHDELTAELSRKHNDANALCLAADLLGEQLMRMIVETWLATNFEGGRHARRIEKLARLENNNSEA
ncbi:MAG TPA: ribose 5-phosphate isomerase B [Phycisphaerae bacterium]|nr:ribose 5-phosphate isomerase B [Phycisphaerae bacterium]